MKSEEFRRLKLIQRLDILKKNGQFIGSRSIPSHRVYLYSLDHFYVELYVIVSLNQIQWIEIQTNSKILSEYSKDVDISGLFD